MAHTVLVADDSKTIRQIVAMALKGAPYTLVEADSASALRQALEQQIDLVLLDYYMPDGDGMELCRAIKSQRGLPVVMLGGTYKPFDPKQAQQAGADGVVMKPFKTDQLLNAMRDALENGGGQPSLPASTPSGSAYSPPASTPSGSAFSPPPTRPPSPFGQPSASAPPASPFGQPSGVPSMPPNPFSSSSSAPAPPQPTPEERRQSGSQPAISAQRASAPAIPPPVAAGTAQAMASAEPGSSSAAPALDMSQMEAMIQEQVRQTVKQELPGLLRNIMGDLLQQKLLPKILKHSEERVNSLLNEQLSTRVQAQVRAEFEKLLDED